MSVLQIEAIVTHMLLATTPLEVSHTTSNHVFVNVTSDKKYFRIFSSRYQNITTPLPLKCGLEQQKDHLPERRKRLGTS